MTSFEYIISYIYIWLPALTVIETKALIRLNYHATLKWRSGYFYFPFDFPPTFSYPNDSSSLL